MLRVLLAVLGAVALVLGPIADAAADGVSCPTGESFSWTARTCVVSVSAPGVSGSAPVPTEAEVIDQGGSVSACVDYSFGGSDAVPCESEYGWWSNEMKCYVRLADPQPEKSDPVWQGNTDGAIYSCQIGAPGVANPFSRFWSESMPAGPAAPVDPAVVAQTIVEQMELRPITIGMVPEDFPGSMGIVGLPMWLWVADPSEQTYGPMTRSASLGDVTVTATAKVKKVLWEMGDGNAVTCWTAGTPFTDGHGGEESPDCGYTYSKQGTYTIRATSYWSVDWTSTSGPSGSIPVQFTQSRIVPVGELQVVRTG